MKKSFIVAAIAFLAVATPFFATAGAVGGSKYADERVNANDEDYYYIEFRGGREAWVTVEGDGDTDLDLYVYDEDGDLVAYDDDFTDYCIAEWTPRRTQEFEIRIVNRGDVYNEYELETN